MSTVNDLHISLVPGGEDGEASLDPAVPTARRDRRQSYRVPLRRHPRAECESACRLTDISAGGVGFLAPRRDASLLENALVLVHLAGTASFRAVVQRVQIGGASRDWVKVGARFVGLAEEERASLCALVTAQSA